MSNVLIESIGALELNCISVPLDDGALEAAAVMMADPQTHGCRFGPTHKYLVSCQRIDAHSTNDGALEASADPQPRPMTIPFQLCRRIDDAALEASVGPVTPTGGAWTQFCCRRIDDGTN